MDYFSPQIQSLTYDEQRVRRLKAQYPIGTRVKLLAMDDSQAPPIGSLGTVYGVDSLGSILVEWDCGSTLSVIYGVDSVAKV